MAFWTLYKREISSYFQSAVGYLVLFGSALAQSIFFMVFLTVSLSNNVKDVSIMQMFFSGIFFWLIVLPQVPLITMRLFSEEFKLGTIEMLLTAPVGEWDVVLAKFFGSLTFYIVLWLPMAFDIFLSYVLSKPIPPVYWAQIGLTALTATLIGGFYISIGMFSSVLTKNQIVAAVISLSLLFVMFFVALWSYVPHTSAFTLDLISYVSGISHMENATQGLYDSRPLVFYISITAFFLVLTKTILESRRLKS